MFKIQFRVQIQIPCDAIILLSPTSLVEHDGFHEQYNMVDS